MTKIDTYPISDLDKTLFAVFIKKLINKKPIHFLYLRTNIE